MAAPASKRSRPWPFGLFLLFVLGYNLFRVALFAMTQTGAVQPDHPLDPTVNAIVVYSELAIGVVGLSAMVGLLGFRAWGFWATVVVNAYAIVFDAASAVGVQLSAAGGAVPPAVILFLLVAFRSRYIPAKAEPAGLPIARA